MRSVLVVMLGISSIASAERDAAVRGGVCWYDTDTSFGPQAQGFAPYVDGELGVRSDYVSLTATGSVFSLHSNFDWDNQSVRLQSHARYVGIDVGARLTFHTAMREGPFIGVGVALENVYETGRSSTCECTGPYCDPCNGGSYQPFDRWSNSTLYEIHTGFDVSTRFGLLDVIALGGFGGDPDPAENEGWLWTVRVATGLRF